MLCTRALAPRVPGRRTLRLGEGTGCPISGPPGCPHLHAPTEWCQHPRSDVLTWPRPSPDAWLVPSCLWALLATVGLLGGLSSLASAPFAQETAFSVRPLPLCIASSQPNSPSPAAIPEPLMPSGVLTPQTTPLSAPVHPARPAVRTEPDHRSSGSFREGPPPSPPGHPSPLASPQSVAQPPTCPSRQGRLRRSPVCARLSQLHALRDRTRHFTSCGR